MERLTMRDVGGRAFWVSPQSPGGGYRLSGDMEDQRRLDRLAAYEDTGLTPEEVKEFLEALESRFVLWINKKYGITAVRFMDIMEADQDGRLVVLPCKVGDTVWTNIAIVGDRYRSADKPYPVEVVFIGMGGNGSFSTFNMVMDGFSRLISTKSTKPSFWPVKKPRRRRKREGRGEMTLTEMFNICDLCVHSPVFCGCDPEICATKPGLILKPKRE